MSHSICQIKIKKEKGKSKQVRTYSVTSGDYANAMVQLFPRSPDVCVGHLPVSIRQ